MVLNPLRYYDPTGHAFEWLKKAWKKTVAAAESSWKVVTATVENSWKVSTAAVEATWDFVTGKKEKSEVNTEFTTKVDKAAAEYVPKVFDAVTEYAQKVERIDKSTNEKGQWDSTIDSAADVGLDAIDDSYGTHLGAVSDVVSTIEYAQDAGKAAQAIDESKNNHYQNIIALGQAQANNEIITEMSILR